MNLMVGLSGNSKHWLDTLAIWKCSADRSSSLRNLRMSLADNSALYLLSIFYLVRLLCIGQGRVHNYLSAYLLDCTPGKIT